MVLAEPAVVAAVAAVVFAAAFVSSIAGFAFSALAGAALIWLLEDPVGTVAIRDLLGGDPRLLRVEGVAQSRLAHARALCRRWRGDRAPGRLGSRPHPRRGVCDGLGIFLVGALGGFRGGLAGFPGAAITVWCGMRGWSKERQRALCQPYILLMLMETLTLVGVASPAKIPSEVTSSG
jgi:hypothetical protein